jgi:2-isopropylmalate synthase|tara:strand:+ start:717 stop:2285 length:1569 start_codon:yes stop_codon:yes gene_type:complete
MPKKVIAYDSTLRDGAQAQGVSFTVEDKLKVVQQLDNLGVSYIEAGNPGSNPKDLAFFERVSELNLKHAKIIAFGSTRKIGIKAADDRNLKSLLSANTEAVAIFGKSWDYQVTDILRTTLEENLAMISDTIAYLKQQGKEVVFDAEHFFDGYKANADYAMLSLKAAADAGADVLCLCDTNGGTFPEEVFQLTQKVVEAFGTQVGIHCHNDCEMAVANSIAAVKAGAVQVQGTINGIGERCGNANLSSIIPNVQLKLGMDCIPASQMVNLTTVSKFVSEIGGVPFNEKAPYVGSDAFSHKGGMHIDAVNKNPISYEHIEPSQVGNERHTLVSEVAGRSALLAKLQEVDPSLTKESDDTKRVLEHLKALEHEGYQFENAEQSFDVRVRQLLGKSQTYFKLVKYNISIKEPGLGESNSKAIVSFLVNSETVNAEAEGGGPVDALDRAMRNALREIYPAIKEVKLTDYKVRVLDSNLATAAKVRVIIESSDAKSSWSTTGVSTDIIEASWIALQDAIEYKLMRDTD